MSYFHPWLKRLLAVALILLMQGPAMLVQEVAWARMLVSYTQERGLKRGVIETFDGNHPCKMCARAAELRKNPEGREPAERQSGSSFLRLSWAEMVPSSMVTLPRASVCWILAPAFMCFADSPGRRADSPESPPPEAG